MFNKNALLLALLAGFIVVGGLSQVKCPAKADQIKHSITQEDIQAAKIEKAKLMLKDVGKGTSSDLAVWANTC